MKVYIHRNQPPHSFVKPCLAFDKKLTFWPKVLTIATITVGHYLIHAKVVCHSLYYELRNGTFVFKF